MSNVHRTMAEEEEAAAENRFQRLPDDVVVNIFDKISDVKCLCRCFVVAKRFSLLVPLVQTLSFQTTTCNSLLTDEQGEIKGETFLKKFSELLTNNFKLTPLLPSPPLNFPDLLFHLKKIQSLSIEIPPHFNPNSDPVLKWGASFSTTLKSFIFLYSTSLSKTHDEIIREETENDVTLGEVARRANVCLDCFKNANLWLGTLACAVPANPMLRSITITDLKNNGVKLCLDGEKLVEYRNTLKISPHVWTLWDMRVGRVPVLELPISGYVMKGVTVVTMNMFGFDETALLDAFAEEKGVFSEAMVQILEKHKGIIRPL